MADVQAGGLQGSGEGTPPNVSSPLSPQGAAEQNQQGGPRYLTEDDVLQLFDTLFDRKAQSIADKTANRVNKVLKAAQEQGVNLTAAQARSLVETFDTVQRDEQNTQQRREQPAQGKPQAPEQPEEQLHPVIYTAMSMMEKAGVNIDEGDPELALIDQVTTDEDVFLASVRAAINAKRARLQQAGNVARMPTVAGGGGAATGGTKASLTAQLNDLLKNPTQNWAEIKRIRGELSKYK